MKPDLVRRFEREAKIASAIKSPYVCQLLEVAEADDGAHLLVFEQLTGESLADRLKREQYLPFSEVGPIIDDVLQGLAPRTRPASSTAISSPATSSSSSSRRRASGARYAPPSGGFRHRRLRPAPGRARRAPRAREDPRLRHLQAHARREGGADAHRVRRDARLVRVHGAGAGARRRARADERADIYAVGAVAFRSLSGRLPFEGPTAAVLVAMKLDRSAPSLAEATGEHWPAGIERFLERALERKKERRFATALEALTAWRSIQPANITRARAHGRAMAAAGRHRCDPTGAIPVVDAAVGTLSGAFLAAEPAIKRGPRAPARRSTGATPRVPNFGAGVTRPPLQSYVPVEDNPTEVDGPPPNFSRRHAPSGDGPSRIHEAQEDRKASRCLTPRS